jgi:AAA domain
MTDALTLAHSRRAFVVAAAGCGKTQLIACAVRHDANHRCLVLTHTHAGVDSLRRRLKSLGAATSSYEVSTIDGWSLRLSTSFPGTSGITTRRPANEEWERVHQATASVLSIPAISTVIRASFDSVYVDEYQDCSLSQHAALLRLADVLPMRIVGDPLQGIFDFGGIVDWDENVKPHFEELPRLCEPHRWKEKNRELGDWLLTVREKLERGEALDLRNVPNRVVEFVPLPADRKACSELQIRRCFAAQCADGETMLAIRQWENQCHTIARRTGGKFKSPETIECCDLFNWSRKLDSAKTSSARAKTTFEFGCLCLTGVSTQLSKTAARIFDGRGLQAGRQYRFRGQLDSLRRVVEAGSLLSVKTALEVLANTPGSVRARHELFSEMLSALREYAVGEHTTLEEAATRVRDRTRRVGRAPSRYVVSRTLLVKGLEFDHVLILDANELDRKNLYVALTRGCRSLTVLATSPILDPH